MKKSLYLVIFTLLAVVSAASAQDYYYDYQYPRLRTRYRNINFSGQKLFAYEDNIDVELGKSTYGLGITIGRSYILHSKPLLRMVHIGIDATWFDMNYAHLKETFGNNIGMDLGLNKSHQADISVGVGPGIHVTPLGKLGIHAYFRYNPTFAMLFDPGSEGFFAGGYSSVFVSGAAVSWGLISLGAEARWGKGKYKEFGGDDDDEYWGGSSKMKLKTKGYRVYVSFRF